MPIFEYACKHCGFEFDVLIRNKGDYPAKCPSCGKPDPEKILSSFAVASGATRASGSECMSCPGMSAGACPGGMCNIN